MNVTLGRPLAATLLLAGVLAVAIFAVGACWADLSLALEERDANADLLARGGVVDRRTKPDPAKPALADPFLGAASATLAAGRLDALVRETAAEAGCSLLSSRAESKPDEGGTAGRIEAQAMLEGQNEALQAALIRWEMSDPLILVDSLTMEPAESSAGLPTDPQAPRLRMSVVLSAFWRAPRS